MKNNLTEKQIKVLEFCRSFSSRNGYSPSTREIAEKIGRTQTAALQHLRALQKKGAVKLTSGIARSIVVL